MIIDFPLIYKVSQRLLDLSPFFCMTLFTKFKSSFQCNSTLRAGGLYESTEEPNKKMRLSRLPPWKGGAPERRAKIEEPKKKDAPLQAHTLEERSTGEAHEN